VATRSREIGIKAALGANPSRLLAQVVREGLSIASFAVAVGAAAAWALSRSFSSMLFGVSGGNAAVITAAALLLIALAALASVIPARRAAAVDPVALLRVD
jgi:ABC-type antimicrobial peptide transport system permease subunit